MGLIAKVSQLRLALSQSGRRAILANFGWLVADKLLRFFIGVFIGFYVARYLGPERLGAIGYATAITSIVLLLAEGGMEALLRRDISAQPELGPRTLATALVWRLSAAVFGYGFIALVYLFGGHEADEQKVLLVLGLMVFQPAIMLPELWFQSRMESRVAVFAQWGAALVGAAARVTLVHIRADLLAFAWVTIAEVSVGAILIAWSARSAGLRLDFGGRIFFAAWKLLCEAWPLLLSGIAVTVYLRIDALMLRHITGEGSVGIYMAGIKFSEIWLFAPGALAVSMVPSLTRARLVGSEVYQQKVNQYCKVSALLGYALAIPTFLLGPFLVKVAFGQSFADSVPVQLVHAWILLFAALGVARGQVCVLEGWTRFHLAATVAGALFNIGMNWLLIPSYGPVGAAFATLAAQVLAAWLSTYFYKPARMLAWMQTWALLKPWPPINHEH